MCYNSSQQYKTKRGIFLMEKEQPAPAPAAAPAAAPAPAAPKKKKTGLIVTIIIVVLALIGGGVAAFLLLGKKSPVDAVIDATKNTYSAITENGLELDGTVSLSGMYSGGVNVAAKISKDKNIEMSLGLDANIMGIKLKCSADAVMSGDTVYFKLDDIADIISMLGYDSMFGGKSTIKMIEGTWLKMDKNTFSSNMPISISLDESSIDNLKNSANIEAYTGSDVEKKFGGDLYKVSPKGSELASIGSDSIIVEIKDNKIARFYTKASVSGIDTIVDFALKYNGEVKVTEPSGALDLTSVMGGSSVKPSSIKPSSYSNLLDDLDLDDLDLDGLDLDDFDTDDINMLMQMLK